MAEPQLSLQMAIDQVSQEKGIEPRVLVEAIEQAILTAAKRHFGADRDLEAEYNPQTGQVDLKMFMTVVEEIDNDQVEIALEDARRYGLDDPDNPLTEGDELGFQIFYLAQDAEEARKQDRQYGSLLGIQQARKGFGRIAAQTAKQVIIQRVRDAERERIFGEFKNRKGELISGTVRRFERGSNIIVELARSSDGQQRTVEAVLSPREQTPRESYRPGDRIVALLKDIDREARGPQIILSRTDVGLLVKLFEMEVPEIYEGIVRIVAAAREPGARSKIAVSSRDSDVDPVGACVGMKGSRVQAVVQELRGEKIDIVPFDKDPARFVCNAIAPAEVLRVVIDDPNATMELVVPDQKLSLAIGRRGQNVRLASQLTGWKLDIVSESRFQQMEEEALRVLSRVDDDEEIARALYRMGFRTLDEVAEAPIEELLTVEGIDEDNVERLRTQAGEAMEKMRQEWIEEASHQPELPTEKGRLMLIRGVSERIADLLDRGGYGSPKTIAAEEDTDRLAIRTRLTHEVAAGVKEAAKTFLAEEWPKIEAGVAEARKVEMKRRAEEEARRKAEEEAQRKADEAAAAVAAAAAEGLGASDEEGAEGQPEEASSEATEAP
ncbi:MAG TPA: transcription termination factor NusA, partial [Polyangiaceae bacterium LLY-WYZ-15_(1-7)]|nr:transcription termination factor NusA [Polyangiaceae bacterium LLY-WYZ-15_(1-7)]